MSFLEVLQTPEFTPELQALLRVGFGVLLLLTLLQALPVARWFFTSGTHGGYLDPSPWRDRIFRPATLFLIFPLWIAAALGLIFDVATPLAALVNICFAYYFFVHTRWSGILRGMGAPGFMTYWMSACVLALEAARHYDPSGRVHEAAVLAFRTDFALIMGCAGTYKAVAGYRHKEGMELGMVNPWWGYQHKFFMRWDPNHFMFGIFNRLAFIVQIGAAILMLIPQTRWIGGALIAISFMGIALQIRLGFLCELVVLCTFLMLGAGTPTGDFAIAYMPAPQVIEAAPLLPYLNEVLLFALVAYTVVLPFAKAGIYWNFYGKRRLPGFLQTVLERYANLVGLIVWRVFTVDVIVFWAEIGFVNPETNEVTPYARFDRPTWKTRFRFWHVGEYITLASIFTTLKYHTSNVDLFQSKLVRYARTLPCPEGQQVRFYYQVIRKRESFEFHPVAEFRVDPRAATVSETQLDPETTIRGAHVASPIHEGAKPGSYAPLSQ